MISHSQFQHCSLSSRGMSALQTQHPACVVLRPAVPLAQAAPVPVRAPLFPCSHPKDKCSLNSTSPVWAEMRWNRCSSAARVQALAVARRIASAHLCLCKWLMPGMDCTTRCLNPGSLMEGERQSVSVTWKWREQIWWYSADVHRRGMFLFVELSDLTDEAGWGPETNHAFKKGVMNRWHKLPWEGGKVTLHKN